MMLPGNFYPGIRATENSSAHRYATHADAGQMNLYLNYAREHWTLPGENPPLGLILCSEKDEAVAHYALGNLHNKVLSSQYKLALPDEKELAEEIAKTRKALVQDIRRTK